MRLLSRSLVPSAAAAIAVALSTGSAAAAGKTYVPNKTGDHTMLGLTNCVVSGNHATFDGGGIYSGFGEGG